MIVGPTFFSSPGGDPYWSNVLLLLPFDGSGQTFVDLGPLSADNALSVNGGGAAETFDQNTGGTLFGESTLQMVQPGAGGGNSINLFVSNTTKALVADSDFCIEYHWRQSSWAAATTPIHAWFTRGSVVTGGPPLLAARSDPTSDLYFRTTNNSPGETLEVGGYSADTWRHVAMQYVAADFKTYVYVGGTKVGEYTSSLNAPSTGFTVSIGDFFGTTAPGPESFGYSLRLANLRITAANRYGNVASIDVPTEPWPTG